MFFGLIQPTATADAPIDGIEELDDEYFEDGFVDYDINMDDLEIEMQYETLQKKVQAQFTAKKDSIAGSIKDTSSAI